MIECSARRLCRADATAALLIAGAHVAAGATVGRVGPRVSGHGVAECDSALTRRRNNRRGARRCTSGGGRLGWRSRRCRIAAHAVQTDVRRSAAVDAAFDLTVFAGASPPPIRALLLTIAGAAVGILTTDGATSGTGAGITGVRQRNGGNWSADAQSDKHRLAEPPDGVATRMGCGEVFGKRVELGTVQETILSGWVEASMRPQ